MKEIPLTQGYTAQVDDEDYEYLSQFTWCIGQGYAVRHSSAKLSCARMHRVILGAPKNMQVDHIDRNPLNNQRSNLRLCTASQNSCNAKSGRQKQSSNYRGVSVHKGKFRAQVTINRKVTHVGVFDCEEDAARAYDVVAKKHYGEFAILNFPEEI